MPRRARPPASNAELHAWNYGRRIAEGGYAPPSVTDVRVWALEQWPDSDEGAAFDRLGHDTFTAWALRGWWAAHTERNSA